MLPPDEKNVPSPPVPDPQHLHIPQHGEGPAARHAGPFAALQVPFLPAAEVRPLYQDYVIPFYNHNLSEFGAAEEAAFSRIRNSISDDLITTLLSDYNWRSRTTATYFALILDRPQHLQHIGKLLLRSDVCFAGAVYCRYLAYLRTPEAIEFLNLYLAFYLTRTQRYFDQHQALAALRHIDKLTGSRHEASHAAAVQLMVEARPDFLNHVSEDRLAGDLRSAARMRG